jgi:hypothetical protein
MSAGSSFGIAIGVACGNIGLGMLLGIGAGSLLALVVALLRSPPKRA